MSNVSLLLEDLAACLCAELTPEGASRPPLCLCGVLPGARVAHDFAWECGEGMAWTRLVSAYPSNGVGNPSDQIGTCGKELGLVIEMGVLRCIGVTNEDGSVEPPTAEQYCATSTGQIDDMLAMRRAVECCASLSTFDQWKLGIYQPFGPQGGVVGGTWPIEVAL